MSGYPLYCLCELRSSWSQVSYCFVLSYMTCTLLQLKLICIMLCFEQYITLGNKMWLSTFRFKVNLPAWRYWVRLTKIFLEHTNRLPTSIGNSVIFNWPHLTEETWQFIHTVSNQPAQWVPRDPYITKGVVWVPRDLHCDGGLAD